MRAECMRYEHAHRRAWYRQVADPQRTEYRVAGISEYLNVQIEEGSILKVTNVTLPKATFVKFRAQSVDFLEIQNPKVALEVTLRKFTCLTVGEIIRLDISKKVYQLEVVELKPGDAASIIETDCITDFAEPVGYVEPKRVHPPSESAAASVGSAGSAVRVPQRAKASDAEAAANAFKPFAGQAKRIDGKGESSDAKSGDCKDLPTAPPATTTSTAAEGSVFGGVGRSLNGSAGGASGAGGVGGGGGGGAGVGGAQAKHTSRIGEQFSKRKAAVSAFTGPGHKLT